jgi:CO/xanthine dehydrogenase Mo-binding subunit
MSKLPDNTASALPKHADYKLIGKNYQTPDMIAKVTGKSKYAEDYRAEGMLFIKLLLSPVPHGHVRNIDMADALAMPGVKAIMTVDDMPKPADAITDMGVKIPANPLGERGLTNDPVYQGEPILARRSRRSGSTSSACRTWSIPWSACARAARMRAWKATSGFDPWLRLDNPRRLRMLRK